MSGWQRRLRVGARSGAARVGLGGALTLISNCNPPASTRVASVQKMLLAFRQDRRRRTADWVGGPAPARRSRRHEPETHGSTQSTRKIKLHGVHRGGDEPVQRADLPRQPRAASVFAELLKRSRYPLDQGGHLALQMVLSAARSRVNPSTFSESWCTCSLACVTAARAAPAPQPPPPNRRPP